MKQTPLQRTMLYALLSLLSVFMLTPFYYMVVTSLKPSAEVAQPTVSFVVHHPTLEPYKELLTGSQFIRSALNSAFIAGAVTLLNLVLCPLAGYAFAKHRFPLREPLFMILLSTMMIPGAVLLVPGFLLVRDLGWLNTWLPLIVPAIGGAYGIYLSRQFIDKIPDALIDAARVDGCSELQIFFHVIFPLCPPLLATLGIFTFLGTWNSFISPLIMLMSEELFTLPLVISMLQGRFFLRENIQMAGAVLSILPVMAVFFIFQRQIVASLASTGLKE